MTLRESILPRIVLLTAALSLMRGGFINAQEIIHPSLLPSIDSLRTSSLSFDHVFNAYIWNGIFQKEFSGRSWNAALQQKLRSRLIKTDRTAIQDEYQGLFSLNLRISEKWNAKLKNNSNVIADNQVIDLSRMAQHQMLAGFEYLPSYNINASAFGGYEINSQENELDRGFAYALGLDAYDVKLEEFIASLHSSWSRSFIGRRSPRTGDMRAVLFRNFGNGVNDSLTVNYNLQRREFYTSLAEASRIAMGIEHNIFQRDATLLDIANNLRYDPSSGISVMSVIGVSNRIVERGNRYIDYSHPDNTAMGSRIQEVQLLFSLMVKWQAFDWLTTESKFTYTEREERHMVQDNMLVSDSTLKKERLSASRLENTAQRTTIMAGLTSDITNNDRVRLLSSATILRYDTPDESNTDDRDELLLTIGTEWIHRFSYALVLSMNSDLTLFHLVYLNQNRSANNNWNRVLRLSAAIEYSPVSWFRTSGRTEVLANYTVSDYDEQVASVRSFSFRHALWTDSTFIELCRNIHFNISGSLRIFERGILKWKEFKENPEEYFIEKTIWPEVFWSSAIGLKIGFGFRYFGQDRYRYQDGVRVFTQGIESIGPTASIEWNGGGSERVTISGWREEQMKNGKQTKVISNLSVLVGFIL